MYVEAVKVRCLLADIDGMKLLNINLETSPLKMMNNSCHANYSTSTCFSQTSQLVAISQHDCCSSVSVKEEVHPYEFCTVP